MNGITKELLHENLSVNENGNLAFAGFDTVELVEKYGSPLMLLDEEMIRKVCKTYKNAMATYLGDGCMPLFASKALSFTGIYKIINEEGLCTDIVSGGELYTAIKAGFPLEKAYFHGNNKTTQEIRYAIDNGIGYFIADNLAEVEEINEYASKKGIVQKLLLRLSPGIDPHTHKAVVTGSVDSKFGTAIETGQAEELVLKVVKLNNVDLKGFHCHIGSQIFETTPFLDAAEIMIKFISLLKTKYGFITDVLNLGGGFGVRYLDSDPKIDYAENIKNIANVLKETCRKHNIIMPKILMEPGRSIVAASGLTLYTAGNIKEIKGYKNYVSVDGGMGDNPRYALYQSPYTVLVANKMNEKPSYTCTIAGRNCESGDLLQEDVVIPKPQKGDIIAVCVTGAYNYAMASNYNKVPRPPIVILSKNGDRLAVRRETYEDLAKYDLD